MSMPGCPNCAKLVEGRCVAQHQLSEVLGRPAHRIGACTVAIVESYLSEIRPGMRVLEVGCGSWEEIRRHCVAVGAHYEAIDTQAEYYGKPSIATRLENLAALSFETDSFDLVIGNQTMEHWAEFGCDTSWGLYQCFRVCRPGGRVFLNVPFYFHGTHQFLYGKENVIRALFAPFSSQVRFEHWGWPTGPFPPIHIYPNFPPMRDRSAHIVDIRAVKDRPLPAGYSNRWGLSGRLSRLVNKPLAWNLYMVLRKFVIVETVDVDDTR
jgi:SAM-dependent methyltransferase